MCEHISFASNFSKEQNYNNKYKIETTIEIFLKEKLSCLKKTFTSIKKKENIILLSV